MTTFSPPGLLRNGHIQSILPTLKWRAPVLALRSRQLRQAAREHILDCGDGVRLLGMHSAHGDKPRPLVMLMHGWEGHVDSQYLLSLSSHLFGLG